MPYHSLALAKSRSEIDTNTQTLILVLMRVAGGGFISTGVEIAILLSILFAAGATGAIYSIFIVCLGTSLGSCYATLLVARNTLGNPPVWLSIATVIFSIIGFLGSLSS